MKTTKIICTALAIGAFGLVTANAQNNKLSYDTNTSSAYTAEADDSDDSKRSKKSKIGVKGGVNVSNLFIDEVDDENVKESYHVGVFSKMNIAGPVSIQPELMYSRKGAEVTYNRNNLQGNVDYTLDYIDMPVLLRFDIGGLNIHAGPYASYLVDAESKTEDVRGSNPPAELNEAAFHSIDYGVAGGLGLEWRFLDMGVRYNYGLRDVGHNRSGDESNMLRNGRNSVAQFYVGLGF